VTLAPPAAVELVNVMSMVLEAPTFTLPKIQARGAKADISCRLAAVPLALGFWIDQHYNRLD